MNNSRLHINRHSPRRNRAALGRGMRLLLAAVAVLTGMSIFAASQGKKGTAIPARSLRQPDTARIAPMVPGANRHQQDRVFLERANELRTVTGADYQIVVGDVEFRKGDMFMYCDSAHFYDAPSSLEAYGNVRMEQGDTLFVYADELIYADSTQLATLYALPGKKVRLINRDVTLTTDVFNYDMAIDLGFYEVGGVLTDKKNRLDSWYGEYSPASKDALFRDNVHLESRGDKDTLNIFTEEMLYNTTTHIAILDTISTIISRDGKIYTRSGVYNTETSVADLYSRSLVVASNGNTLTADTLYYDRDTGFGEGFGSIELTDTTNKMILCGDYGYYYELADSAMVTGHALAKEYSNTADTLYLHSDTIRAFRVLSNIPVRAENSIDENLLPPAGDGGDVSLKMMADIAAGDSATMQADTTHFVVAAPHVKFYRSDLQGLCDSLTFVQRDSMLYMNYHPVVWNETKQIFGNIIQVHLNDSAPEWAKLPEFGFMAEWIDEQFYNQLSGKEMYATFANGTIKHLDVIGNVEAIMLPMENDSTYNKIANVESSTLAADFKGQTIERLKMWPETSGTMTPLYLAKKSLFYLPQFRWFEPLRPLRWEDVMEISPEMLDLMAEPPFGNRKSNKN